MIIFCRFSHLEEKSDQNIRLKLEKAVFVVSICLLLSIPDEAKVIPDETKSIPPAVNDIREDTPSIPGDIFDIRDAIPCKHNVLTDTPFGITFVLVAVYSIRYGWVDTHAEGTDLLCDCAYIRDVINSIPDRAEDMHNGSTGISDMDNP